MGLLNYLEQIIAQLEQDIAIKNEKIKTLQSQIEELKKNKKN